MSCGFGAAVRRLVQLQLQGGRLVALVEHSVTRVPRSQGSSGRTQRYNGTALVGGSRDLRGREAPKAVVMWPRMRWSQIVTLVR